MFNSLGFEWNFGGFLLGFGGFLVALVLFLHGICGNSCNSVVGTDCLVHQRLGWVFFFSRPVSQVARSHQNCRRGCLAEKCAGVFVFFDSEEKNLLEMASKPFKGLGFLTFFF